MKQGNRRLLAILVVLITIVIVLAAGNTYIYLSRVREIQNSIIALQQAKTQSGPQGLQGPSGIVGEQGIRGPIGPQGLQGTMGLQGAQGLQGPPGEIGATGAVGPQGVQGETGPQGNPGADGRQVEFQCDPNNDDYEYRYVGDDGWIIIQRNSDACKSPVL